MPSASRARPTRRRGLRPRFKRIATPTESESDANLQSRLQSSMLRFSWTHGEIDSIGRPSGKRSNEPRVQHPKLSGTERSFGMLPASKCVVRRLSPIFLSDIGSFQYPGHASTKSGKIDLTSMTVSLPATQKAYVKAQAAMSGCSTPSEYIRRLIHANQRAREQEELEQRILEGLASPSREMTSEAWQELRTTLRRKLTKRRKAHFRSSQTKG